MENNILDKFFKKMLEHLDDGEPGNTWTQLNEKMDANLVPTSTEDLSFDQSIKSSLTDLNAIEMADWDNFLPSLELVENLDSIDQDLLIDNTVKENLENLHDDYSPASWDALSQKLDLDDVLIHENEDQELDQLAYDNLLNITVPQRAGDWEELEQKLDNEGVISTPLLFKYKLIELAILSLLLLTFFQAKPLFNKAKESKAVDIAHLATITESDINIPVSTLEAKEKEASTKALTKESSKKSSISNSPLEKNTVTRARVAPVQEIISKKIIRQNYNATPQNSVSIPNKIVASNEEIVLEISSATTPIIKGNNAQSKKENKNQLVVADNNNVDQGIGPILSTAQLPIGSLVSLDFHDKGVQFCKSCYNLTSILKWRLGAHIDTKYDYIMTAYDNIFDLESYNHSTLSYGAGLSTSLLIGKWELESGFDYSTRQYNTNTNEILGSLSNGYLRVRLDKIQMNVLSIPLNLRYHFKDQAKKTHFYVHAGASLHVATQTNYFITSEFIRNASRPGQGETDRLVEESNTTSDKIYLPGWFEGGSFLENRYFTVNLGIGFERKISARYSIFGQTTYAHYLANRGLGPNDDRFNSVGLSTGIRALFK